MISKKKMSPAFWLRQDDRGCSRPAGTTWSFSPIWTYRMRFCLKKQTQKAKGKDGRKERKVVQERTEKGKHRSGHTICQNLYPFPWVRAYPNSPRTQVALPPRPAPPRPVSFRPAPPRPAPVVRSGKVRRDFLYLKNFRREPEGSATELQFADTPGRKVSSVSALAAMLRSDPILCLGCGTLGAIYRYECLFGREQILKRSFVTFQYQRSASQSTPVTWHILSLHQLAARGRREKARANFI